VSVFGLDVDNAIRGVEIVPVWAEAGLLAHAAAVRITRAESSDYVLIAEPVRNIRATWRVCEVETDARMLFCRTRGDGHITRLAIVDGSFVRGGGAGDLELVLPRPAPDLHLHVTRPPLRGVATAEGHVSGLALGAELRVCGRAQPIALERRATERLMHGR